jgi:hypothetical protein
MNFFMKREAIVSHHFMSAEFLDLSPDELLAKCREYRAEAERLAATTSSDMRRRYIHLVAQWSLLAEDIKRTQAGLHEEPLSAQSPV